MSGRSSLSGCLAVLGGLCALACMIPGARGAAARESAAVAAARASLIAQLRHLRPDISRIDATVIGHPASPLPAGKSWALPLHAMRGHALAPHLCVWVEVRSADREVSSVPVWFAVKAYRPVLVSATHHWARDSVGAQDFTVETRDVAGLGAIPVDVKASLAGMRARRALAPGHILLRPDIEPVPEVLRGDKVAVQVTDGPVAIETDGIALREARLGQTIELRNPTSQKTYTAQVVGRGRAAVEVSR